MKGDKGAGKDVWVGKRSEQGAPTLAAPGRCLDTSVGSLPAPRSSALKLLQCCKKASPGTPGWLSG